MIETGLLSEAFVELADTLVDDFDLIDFLTTLSDRCADLLGPAEAGVMLIDAEGHLQVMASTNERSRLLELFELQNDEGPCLDSIRTGTAIINHSVQSDESPWPRFDTAARELGFTWAHAFPMRVRSDRIGAINVFCPADHQLDATAVTVGRALADVAAVGLLQERSLREAHILNEQLQTALNTRVTIEQAKGLLAERLNVGVDEAFAALRRYARSNSQRLTNVAAALMAGTLDSAQIPIDTPMRTGPDRSRWPGPSPDTARLLHTAAELDPAHRQLLRWYFIDNRSATEIAKQLDSDPEAILDDLANAIGQLAHITPEDAEPT